MKNIRKNIYHKISQGGTMMVEAMAMLALIALVTPTLYKKSAERTSELQDINTATHVRTLTKAVDNYVSANYQNLLENSLADDDSYLAISLEPDGELASFLPYGFSYSDVIKNFEKPIIVIKRQGSSGSITSFVQLPKKSDIGEMRSARIASMVGSNGGYIDNSKNAQGVGGVWGLTEAQLNDMGLKTDTGSVIVASSEAINSATSGALENEKYLQRTQVEHPEDLWRNAMSTDLYMGGLNNAPDGDAMYRILGVKQMIVGATEHDNEDVYDLVLSEDAEKGGSAWLGGEFAALSDTFSILGEPDNAELIFGGSDAAGQQTIYANTGTGEIRFNDGDVIFEAEGDGAATFSVNTLVDAELESTGNTHLAQNEDTTFKVGPNGDYISADKTDVSILAGNITTHTDYDGGGVGNRNTKINTDLIVTGTTDLEKAVKIGTGHTGPTENNFLYGKDVMLNVEGNVYVSDTLEANKLKTTEFDVLNLHAGGNSLAEPEENRWFHATADGVKITDPTRGNTERLLIDKDYTHLYGTSEETMFHLGENDAILTGNTSVEVSTATSNGTVRLQKNQNGRSAITLNRQPGDDNGNEVTIDATSTDVITGKFRVGNSNDNADTYFNIKAETAADANDSKAEIMTNETYISSGYTNISAQKLDINGNPIFNVSPDNINTAAGKVPVVGVDSKQLLVTAALDTYNSEDGTATWHETPKQILRVDASSTEPTNYAYYEPDNTPTDGGRDLEDEASIYIRRGAIEVENYNSNSSITAADAGMGYIEASRFVSNATDANGNQVNPVYSDDYNDRNNGNLIYYSDQSKYKNPDRYMINPAYTSVMHDIKLTTRGGTRLSDILPDFINKGIYVVNNTYKDNLDVNNIKVDDNVTGRQITVEGAEEITAAELSGSDRWASPFLGVVPAPQCPPGHARVITITPAGFMMAQSGNMWYHDALNPFGGANKRFVVGQMLGEEPNLDTLVTKADKLGNNQSFTEADKRSAEVVVDSNTGAKQTIYYLGYADEATSDIGLQPLYFQQSTWLKSKVIPQEAGKPGSCNDKGNGEQCGANFVGWSAVMGFIYPKSLYASVLTKLGVTTLDNDYYWNVFPVMTQTLEAYATVYCYFDRTNIYQSGIDGKYVDQYDQLNYFRGGYKKDSNSDNQEYIDRLNDPTLIYNNPW